MGQGRPPFATTLYCCRLRTVGRASISAGFDSHVTSITSVAASSSGGNRDAQYRDDRVAVRFEVQQMPRRGIVGK